MRYVADTIAIVRHLMNSRKIGAKAKEIFRKTDRGEDQVYISAITLMELLYLSEKGRIDVDLIDITKLITDSDNYHVYPVDVSVVLTARTIDDIPELHDRIIAATAKLLTSPLITHDEIITRSKSVKTL